MCTMQLLLAFKSALLFFGEDRLLVLLKRDLCGGVEGRLP